MASSTIPRTCEFCGETYMLPYERRKLNQRYCSYSCANRARPRPPRTARTCEICQAVFYVTPHLSKKYCTRKCYYASVANFDTTLDMFMKRVRKTETCWLWTGFLDAKGYGSGVRIKGRAERPHRAMYELSFGLIPKGLVVRHKCDNPPCVKPEHLEIGTCLDNVRDMIERGRMRHNNPPRGARNSHAKLTEDAVRAIRARYAQGDTPLTVIAAEFQIGVSGVAHIVHKRSWRHLD